MRPVNLLETLDRLDREPAGDLESETLEFKSWDTSRGHLKERIRKVREAVVAMANAKGGTIVLGVHDRARSRAEAIHGVGDLDSDDLRRDIYDGTDPPILVDAEEIRVPEGRLLALWIPRGIPPHLTTDGVIRVRVGRETKPVGAAALANLTSGLGGRDPTAELVSEADFDDLAPEAFIRLRATIEAEDRTPELARLPDRQLLERLELVSGEDLTVAAILLLGKRTVLARIAPNHEVVFARFPERAGYSQRRDLRGAFLEILDDTLQTLAANTGITTVAAEGLRDLEIPDVSRWVAREALLNAVTHRNYFLNESVLIHLHADRLEITSPGGFPSDIEPGNLLRHAPVHRNRLLARVFQTVGLVNRAGLGVSQIHERQLRHGKPLPRYSAGMDHVRLTLFSRTDPDFVRFVDSEKQSGQELTLDDLLVLRSLTEADFLDRWSAGEVLQCPPAEAAEFLASLRQRAYLTTTGRGRTMKYRLADLLAHLRQIPPVAFSSDRSEPAQQILGVLERGGRLTNRAVRELTGLSRNEALRVLNALRDAELARVEGTRRGASWVAGPRLRHPPSGRLLAER